MSGSLWCKGCTTWILMKNGGSRWCWSHFLPLCLSGPRCGILSWCCCMLLVIRIPFHFGLVFTVSLTHRAVHAHGVRADKIFWSSWVCEIAAGGIPVKCESLLTKEEFNCSSLCAFIGAICAQIFQLWHWLSVMRSHVGSKLGTLSAFKWRSIVCPDNPRYPKQREDIVHAGYDHIGRVATEEVHHSLTWVGIHSHRGLDGRRLPKLALPDSWVLWHLRELSHLEWFCSGECTVVLFPILGNQTSSLRRITAGLHFQCSWV